MFGGLNANYWWNNAGSRNPVLDSPTNGNWSGGFGGGTTGAAGTSEVFCDKKLVDELRALPSDPRRWPRPPAPGTEGDSDRYRRGAIIIFGR